MWYHIYEAQMQASAPFRAAALAALQMRPALNGAGDGLGMRQMMAALEMASRAKLTHVSQPFGIKSVMVENRESLVVEEVAFDLPFGRLLHFRKDIDSAAQGGDRRPAVWPLCNAPARHREDHAAGS